MTKKEKLANQYIELRKEFDGPDFKENISDNQVWYLTRNFKVWQLEDKISAVKRAIEEKEIRLKKEAYFATPEGQAFKQNIENEINKSRETYHNVKDEFENWIKTEVNNMVPGNWGANLSISYMGGNVTIGLLNRDPKRNFEFQFGHDFTIYFDSYQYRKDTPRFELNYGTLGSFDLFEDETRPLYLNGLSTISNNKEWLQILMAKFNEYVKKLNTISKEIDELGKKLNNPNI